MEMAGIVCYTGASIIMQAREIVEQIGYNALCDELLLKKYQSTICNFKYMLLIPL